MDTLKQCICVPNLTTSLSDDAYYKKFEIGYDIAECLNILEEVSNILIIIYVF
jgi:hypothetical protein